MSIHRALLTATTGLLAIMLLFATRAQPVAQAQSGDRPAAVRIDTGAGHGVATVYWTEPNDASITKWQYRTSWDPWAPWAPAGWGAGAKTAWMDVPNSYARTYKHTVPGPGGEGTLYFEVRAVNANGAGPASNELGARIKAKTVTLSTSSPTVTEGNDDVTNVAVTVTLSEPAGSGGEEVEIDFRHAISTASGTTTGNQGRALRTCDNKIATDDVCGPASVRVAEGETTATYQLGVVGDTRDEGDETVYLKPYADSSWSHQMLRLVIVDNDGTAATVTPPSPHTLLPTATNTPLPTNTPTLTHTPRPTATLEPIPELIGEIGKATHTPLPTIVGQSVQYGTDTGTMKFETSGAPTSAPELHVELPTATPIPPTPTHTPLPTDTPHVTRDKPPAPVRKLAVTPAGTSATVTWKKPTADNPHRCLPADPPQYRYKVVLWTGAVGDRIDREEVVDHTLTSARVAEITGLTSGTQYAALVTSYSAECDNWANPQRVIWTQP